MNHSDDSNKANNSNKASAAIASHPNLNRTKRNNGIYERFISRIQSIDNAANSSSDVNTDSDNSKKNDLHTVKESASYELFSEDELQIFTDDKSQTDAINIPSDSDDSHNNNQEVVANVAPYTLNASTPEHSINPDSHSTDSAIAAQTPVNSGKRTSARKLTIISLISGLSISAIIVVILNATGILSDLTADSVPTPVTSESVVEEANVVTATSKLPDTQNANPLVKVAAPEVEKESAIDTVAVKNSDNDSKAMVEQTNTVETSTKLNTASDSEASTTAKAAISIEDFKEEAGSTLYREETDN